MRIKCSGAWQLVVSIFPLRFARTARIVLPVLVAVIVALGQVETAQAVTILSAQSGDWNKSSTWQGGTVPDDDDDAVIQPGHTINANIKPIRVLSLTVNGTLTNGSKNVQVYAPFITVNANGTIESSGGDAGDRFIELRNVSATFGAFVNDGLIRAGDGGPRGGSVQVVFFNGTATNRDTIRGGDGSIGGYATVQARRVENGTATIRALIQGGRGTNGEGGDAWVHADQFLGVGPVGADNHVDSRIKGGSGSGDEGGSASMVAMGGTATNHDNGMIFGGNGCPGGDATLDGSVTEDRGRVEAGVNVGCSGSRTTVEPPTGTITEEAQISGDLVDLIAGELLVIGNLFNSNAISAAQDLDITLAPGGVLDLRNNASGTTWFSAGNSIVIKADEILLDNGVQLDDIMSPSPTWQGGGRYTQLAVPPDQMALPAEVGETLTLNFYVCGVCNLPEVIDYQITDTAGWLTAPITVTGVPLEPSASIEIPVQVTVPAVGGISTFTLTASTQTAGEPVDNVTSSIRVVTEGGLARTKPKIQRPRPVHSNAFTDTFNLAWFDFGLGVADAQGWTSTATAFGDFAALYAGVNVAQDDPCFLNFSFLWGFFDDPLITAYLCHIPTPLPLQGAVRYGPDFGLFMDNEIQSPWIPNVGAGSEYLLSFRVYRDLPADNLLFYRWAVRTRTSGVPTEWRDFGVVYYDASKAWHADSYSIGAIVDPTADDVQISLGVVDMCGPWCGTLGTGACHSQGPLFDDVHLQRINAAGPQWHVEDFLLFQDTFANDGTLTGFARADIACDIAPIGSPIEPGDSVVATISNVGTDPITGIGPSAYIYVSLQPQGQPAKSPSDLEAPETRAVIGKRFPLVGTFVGPQSRTWACFRMDTVVTASGAVVPGAYCVDLNDYVFTPGDTIYYTFSATDGGGNWSYYTRRDNGQGAGFTSSSQWSVLSSPMEFTVLPAGGWFRGGDILYVDDADDNAEVQNHFDSSFKLLGIHDVVDRYDVLGPSSMAGNGLGSRVQNINQQILACYRKIIWSSGRLSSGLIGDGTGVPEKSDDYGLLFQFLDAGANNPGVYISGDNIAQEWVTLSGAGAIGLRSIYMNFNLVDGSHVNAGEVVSPTLTAAGPCFIHLGVPDALIAFGGCPLINDFDVLQTSGLSQTEFPYPGGSGDAVISQSTPNNGGSTGRVILSGFSYHYIRDIVPGFPPLRVEHLRDILIWLVNVIPNPVGIPNATARNFLENAAPNPFNPETTIRYGVRERGDVVLRIYNVAGQLVRTLVNEVKSPRPGGFEATWDGRNDHGAEVSSGVYFYRLTARGFSKTKKIVLLK